MALRKLFAHSTMICALLVFGGCPDEPDPGVIPLPDVPSDAPPKTDGDNPPPPIQCSSNVDCGAMVGQDPCNIGSCNLDLGECELFTLPNCCASDADCDDGNANTVDTCDADKGSICVHEDTSKPCQTDADCVTGVPCETFACNGVCSVWLKPDCCQNADDCDDGNACTFDQCNQFKCEYEESDDPKCCGELVFTESFSSGLPDAFTVAGNGEPVAWHHSTTKAHSEGGAAYFADPATGTYLNPTVENAVPASQGTLITPSIAVPPDGGALSFWLWLDIESVEDYDLFFLEARSPDGTSTVIWDKSELGEDQYFTWTLVSLDLDGFKGQSVTFAWIVDTIDGTVNDKTGIFIDDVAVTGACGTTEGCTSDAECDDGNPCTGDQCGADGLCISTTVTDCCQSDNDCAIFDDLCAEFLGCIQNACSYKNTCCTSDDECQDDDPCTAGFCGPDGQCTFELVPDCCQPTPLLTMNFDGSAGVNIQNNQDAGGWNVSSLNAHSAPTSLHYGDPDGGGYSFGGISSSGTTTLSIVDLPQNETIRVSFWIYADIEQFIGADDLELRILTTTGEQVAVWSKGALDTFQEWREVQVDLSQFAGAPSVELSFWFDTVDAIENSGQGVFIDDIQLSYGCGDVQPCDPAMCFDGDPCTDDFCTEDGQCVNIPNPDCGGCTDPAQCNDGDPCTADFCQNGECQNIPIPGCGQVDCDGPEDCNDGNDCTADFCQGGECLNLGIPGCGGDCQVAADCEDADPCTIDSCVQGNCQYAPSPFCPPDCLNNQDCNDNNNCTQDFCGDDGLCSHIEIPGCGGMCNGPEDCNDNNDCTADFCQGGQCANIPIPGCGGGCTGPQDCNDNNACTADFCQNGQCLNLDIPGCLGECDSNSDCLDGDPCTQDICDNGQCEHFPIPGCGQECVDGFDCFDGEECTEDLCLGGQCEHPQIPGCGEQCQTDDQCNDFLDCTQDFCAGAVCHHELDPGCLNCKTGTAYSTSFSPDAAGQVPLPWTMSGTNNGVGWHIGAFPQAFSAPGALYYGNPETMSYDSQNGSSGTATSPGIILGEAADQILLTFMVALHIEGTGGFDQLKLEVVNGQGEAEELWNKSSYQGAFNALEPWLLQTVNLTPWAGQAVQLRFSFDTVDGILNETTGVFVDDLNISQNCGDPQCANGLDCNDNDVCTQDTCQNGLCVNTPDPDCQPPCTNDEQCQDNNPCTFNICMDSGACASAPVPNCCVNDNQCNDGDACTTDLCGPNNACVGVPIPGCGGECDSDDQCQDDNPCTSGFCAMNQCVSVTVPGCCTGNFQCADNDDCTEDLCLQNQCANLPIPGCGGECNGAGDCNDNNQCTVDFCVQGQCQHFEQPNCCVDSSQCNDNNACTDDVCTNNGQCQFIGKEGCCTNDADCNDNNPCTAEACGANNTCQQKTLPGCCTQNAQCADDNACTQDLCTNNKCSHVPDPTCCTANAQCNDGNDCTADTCSADGQCAFQPIAGCCVGDAACSDGQACTLDQCLNNKCSNTALPGCCSSNGECEDGDKCTANVCGADNKCSSTVIANCCTQASDCADGNACTTDTCGANGQCSNAPIAGCTSCTNHAQCADTSPCTADQCNGNGVCVNGYIPGCCTKNEHCVDADICTDDACVANKCVHTTLPACCESDAECNDGNACTTNTCTNNACATAAIEGCCSSDAQCEDGDGCTIDSCTGNTCVSVNDPDCCVETALLGDDFEGGGGPGWFFFKAETAAKWQFASGQQANGGTGALWFGNAATGDFSSGQGESLGRVATPHMDLPAGKSILMTLSIWLDVEQTNSFDTMEIQIVEILAGGVLSEPVVLWDKSALNGEMGQWHTLKLNLTAFAGKPARVIFDFASGDGIQNGGGGVYIDDIAVATSCEDLTNVCVFNGECDDGQPCTNDVCQGGTCQNNVVPDCCTSNAECDDNYACTEDFCNDEGECQHNQKDGCCVFNGECNDDNPCTADACANNQCVFKPNGQDGCCAGDADCDDGNDCTKGFCEDNQCFFQADTGPNCCEPANLIETGFDDATGGGFTFILDGSEAKWSVQQKRFFSPPFSLYFGIPGQWNYQTDEAASGIAISPDVTIPLTAAGATLSFQTWFDTTSFGGGGGNFGDIYNVKVLSENVLKTVWTAPAGQGNQSQWVQASVDLSAYKGKTIQIYWNFQAQNSPFGEPGEGIYVDDVNVSTSCN